MKKIDMPYEKKTQAPCKLDHSQGEKAQEDL